jgi:hypothetical protein
VRHPRAGRPSVAARAASAEKTAAPAAHQAAWPVAAATSSHGPTPRRAHRMRESEKEAKMEAAATV